MLRDILTLQNPQAYQTLTPIGPAAAAVFLASLMASGFSSSAVGTMAGQLIMQGFVGFSIPVWVLRRENDNGGHQGTAGRQVKG